MSGKELYPPPGQQEPTNQNSPAPAEQNPGQQAPRQQQNVPLGQQTMPPQYIPPQQLYMPAGQAMPQPQYMLQYYQQPMPRQQYYQQQQPGQAMPQYQQQGFGPQPMPSPGVGQSPNPFLGTLQPWSTGLFDCAQDLENTLITAFFPCITFGQIAEITDRGLSSCVGAGIIYGLLMWCAWLHWAYAWLYRTKLRANYSLVEDPCHDFLVHCFCDPCALCQEYRELKNRGFVMELGWAGNMQMQQNAAAASVPPPVQSMTE